MYSEQVYDISLKKYVVYHIHFNYIDNFLFMAKIDMANHASIVGYVQYK